jgi:hypothetical protein
MPEWISQKAILRRWSEELIRGRDGSGWASGARGWRWRPHFARRRERVDALQPATELDVRRVADEADVALRRWRTNGADRRWRQLQLRYPVGPDALPLLKWRASDEEIVAGGAASDEEYKAAIKREFGLDVDI